MRGARARRDDETRPLAAAAVLAHRAEDARQPGRAAGQREADELQLRLVLRRSSLLHAGLIAVAAAGVIALLVFHGPNWSKVGHALAGMSWGWAAAAVFLNFVSALARAMSWNNVIKEAVPEPHPRLMDVFSAF